MHPPSRFFNCRGTILKCCCVAILAGAMQQIPAQSEPAPVFETDIAPILATSCVTCHGEDSPQAGLDVRSASALLAGGKSGPAIVPGAPVDSLLLQKVASGAMPMGGSRLARAEVEAIRRWIESGAEAEHAALPEFAGHRGVSPREILVTVINVKCLLCHGRRVQEGGLDLRTRESALAGGASGPAIRPGDPDGSLLIQRIAAEEMPPPEHQARLSYRPVTSDELDSLREWIRDGAPWDDEKPTAVDPAKDPLVSAADRDFWAFQPPRRPPVPPVTAQHRVRHPIDSFLIARLERDSLTFSPAADKATLIRRAHFDVTGLAPSPEEIERYLADSTENSYERMIDRLLESPRYGEHWGRMWLDAAGYADSEGQVDFDAVRPHAWRYRDWVIRSLNEDKPYDQFLTEQIAGDELFNYREAKLPLSRGGQRQACRYRLPTYGPRRHLQRLPRLRRRAHDRGGRPAADPDLDGPRLDSGLCSLPRPQVRPDPAARLLPAERHPTELLRSLRLALTQRG